jgi:hypothetical protein
MVAHAAKEWRVSQNGGRATAARWERCLAAWAKSGLTQVEFCKREGLSVFSLRWWKWNLSRQSGEVQRGQRLRLSQAAGKKPGFVSLQVVEPARPQERRRAGDIEIILRTHHRVRLSSTVDLDFLTRLVASLERLP